MEYYPYIYVKELYLVTNFSRKTFIIWWVAVLKLTTIKNITLSEAEVEEIIAACRTRFYERLKYGTKSELIALSSVVRKLGDTELAYEVMESVNDRFKP